MRTKGSKNKKKDETKILPNSDIEVTRDSAKGIVHKEEPKIVGHSVYVPTPDMGEIKPPPKAVEVCACSHKNETHYGGERGHCNSPGCSCLRFE